jgi:hypothetical protein
MRCIKILTLDDRIYYTNYSNIKNIKKLKIIIKNYRIVKYKNQEILKIEQIIKVICSHTLNQKNSINNNISNKIKNFIKDSFEKNKILNFIELKKKFSKYNIKNINLYNHLNQVKKIYKKAGKEIKRTKTGIFELN